MAQLGSRFEKEAQILNVIEMIKNKDPMLGDLDGSLRNRIHDKDFKPFENLEEKEVEPKKAKKDKLWVLCLPLTL